MSQALENKQAKLGKLASEISYIWDNKIELMSKQKIQTWKGLLFVSIVAVIGLIIAIAVILS
jgi:hypothetical protein